MPITPLILGMSLPIMFSMLVQALYNIVDSIFVAQINENALTAVSLAFPVQNLMISVGVGTAIGVNALLSMRLGQKNQEAVNATAMNGLFLSLCSYLAFVLAGIFFIHPYLAGQTSDAEILRFGKSYLYIVVFGSFGVFGEIMFERLLQATGSTMFTMVSQLVGALSNIILDPLFIFGIGPFPKMGIAGAAFATVLGPFFGMLIALVLNLTNNHDIQFHFRSFRPSGEIIGQIYNVGVPSVLLNSLTSVTIYFFNRILAGFSTTAIAVYGVLFKMNSFIYLPVIGLNNGVVPIIAYNYGAEHKTRLMQTIINATLIAVIIMTAGMLLFEIFPARFLRLFNASEAMIAIGVPAMRIISTSFIGAAVAISLGSIFQGFSSASYSMITSFARQLLVLLPSAYFLSKTGNVNNVWWAFPIAEVISVAFSVFFMMRIYSQKIKVLHDR